MSDNGPIAGSMPGPPRIDVVMQLFRVCRDALEANVGDASSTEVVSACVALMLAMMMVLRDMGGNLEGLRGPIEEMYSYLPPRPTREN